MCQSVDRRSSTVIRNALPRIFIRSCHCVYMPALGILYSHLKGLTIYFCPGFRTLPIQSLSAYSLPRYPILGQPIIFLWTMILFHYPLYNRLLPYIIICYLFYSWTVFNWRNKSHFWRLYPSTKILSWKPMIPGTKEGITSNL